MKFYMCYNSYGKGYFYASLVAGAAVSRCHLRERTESAAS